MLKDELKEDTHVEQCKGFPRNSNSLWTNNISKDTRLHEQQHFSFKDINVATFSYFKLEVSNSDYIIKINSKYIANKLGNT